MPSTYARALDPPRRVVAGLRPAAASPITASIARALADRGWTVKHQVGCGPYKLDLAVLDPADPERFVLAMDAAASEMFTRSKARKNDPSQITSYFAYFPNIESLHSGYQDKRIDELFDELRDQVVILVLLLRPAGLFARGRATLVDRV